MAQQVEPAQGLRSRFRFVVVVLTMVGLPAEGFENDAPLADPVLEARAVALARALRCLVCQNQSIVESDAPLARDLRALVRERIAGGDDDGEVKAYVVARYGDFVLLRPPFKPKTWGLWLGPAFVVLIAILVLARFRRAARTPPAPLDAGERARLDSLLDSGGRDT